MKWYDKFKYFKPTHLDIIKRDGYKCRKCGSKTQLVVHHIREAKDRPDLYYEPSNLVTLCRSCHFKLHIKRNTRRKRIAKRER